MTSGSKITQLTSASALQAHDIFPFVSGSTTTPTTKYIRTDKIFTNIPSDVTFGSGVDVYTDAWTDYSTATTLIGWASTTVKQLSYKKIGNLVFVNFAIVGTSGSATSSFTVPYSGLATIGFRNLIQTRDNSGSTTVGWASLASGNKVNLFQGIEDTATASWTASGSKAAYGQFFYEIA